MSRTAVSAVEHVKKLRGGSQAHLLRASDGNCYVTKFQNNPQHVRVLANEFFASRIGISLGLPIPEPQLIEVSDELIERFDLKIESAGHSVPFQAGLHLGSRYVADPERDILFDYLPESMFQRVANIEDFATNGYATATVARPYSQKKRVSVRITPPLSIRVTASMRRFGVSPT